MDVERNSFTEKLKLVAMPRKFARLTRGASLSCDLQSLSLRKSPWRDSPSSNNSPVQAHHSAAQCDGTMQCSESTEQLGHADQLTVR
jgi:hypothetical protein